MAKKAVSKSLKNQGMQIQTRIFFTIIFFMMGFSIIGAGLKGEEATAPIVMLIGMMMVLIGLAPWYVPFVHKRLVPENLPYS